MVIPVRFTDPEVTFLNFLFLLPKIPGIQSRYVGITTFWKVREKNHCKKGFVFLSSWLVDPDRIASADPDPGEPLQRRNVIFCHAGVCGQWAGLRDLLAVQLRAGGAQPSPHVTSRVCRHAQTGQSSAHQCVGAYPDLDSNFKVVFVTVTERETTFTSCHPSSMPPCSNRSVFCSPVCRGISGSWFTFQSGFCSGNRKRTNLHFMSPLEYAAILIQISPLLTRVLDLVQIWIWIPISKKFPFRMQIEKNSVCFL